MSNCINPLRYRPSYRMIERPETAQIHKYHIEGRTFSLDKNSMLIYEGEDEVQPSPLSPQFPLRLVQSVRSLVFNITHACNLRCKYCFLDNYYPEMSKMMSLDTALHALRVLAPAQVVERQGSISIGYFGGEPLANFDVMRSMTEAAELIYYPAKISWGLTTNACLVTDEIAKFMASRNFSAIVSLDGPKELHNRHRFNKAGRGSFDQTMDGLKRMADAGMKKITLRSTFLPDQVQLLDRVAYLNALCDEGLARGASVEPACLSESLCAPIAPELVFTPEIVQGLSGEYLETAKWISSRFQDDMPARMHQVIKTLERYAHHLHAPSECGAGVGYVGVGPDGDLYACHRETHSHIGNIFKGGIDESSRAAWMDNRSYKHDKCNKCPVQWACGGGCREAAIAHTGDINEPDPVACAFKELFSMASIWIMANTPIDVVRKHVPHPKEQKQSCKVPSNDKTIVDVCGGDCCSA